MKNQIKLLQRASDEIRQLRSQNKLMGARLDMFDNMMSLFNTLPCRNGQGFAPDIVYEIEKEIEAQNLNKE